MKFNISTIAVSNNDKKRAIRFPEHLTTELAEFIGIVVGDGHLSHYPGFTTTGYKIVRTDVRIACNKNEADYIAYIEDLCYSLFSIRPAKVVDKRDSSIILRIYSKGLVLYLSTICGITLNRKSDIVSIPRIIKKSSARIKCAFLRGLADTDFAVTFKNRAGKGHTYPVIKASFKSKHLVDDLVELYGELGFKYCTYYYELRKDKRFHNLIMHNVYLNGRDNLARWIKLIGFSNLKFQRKVEKWEREGICPPGY